MSAYLSLAGGTLIAIALAVNTPLYSIALMLSSVVGFPALALFGFVSFLLLGKWMPIMVQIARFCIVGFLSTAIEIAVINVLFAVSGQTAGIYFSLFKTLTFLIALGNGYFFNKIWTFKSEERRVHIEFSKYAGVNLVGIVLNVGTASLIVNVIGAPVGFSETVWANIGVIVAVFVVMVWNFTSYRLFVFNKSAKEYDNTQSKERSTSRSDA
jgi:putative flippase GtrA